jgi:hypothetical protein
LLGLNSKLVQVAYSYQPSPSAIDNSLIELVEETLPNALEALTEILPRVRQDMRF